MCKAKPHQRFPSKYINVSPTGGQTAGGHRELVVSGEANPNGKMLHIRLFHILQAFLAVSIKKNISKEGITLCDDVR